MLVLKVKLKKTFLTLSYPAENNNDTRIELAVLLFYIHS